MRRIRKFKIVNCTLSIILSRLILNIKINVDKKVEFPTDSQYTVKNICTINQYNIQSITSSATSGNNDIINTTFLSGDGDNFIQETM